MTSGAWSVTDEFTAVVTERGLVVPHAGQEKKRAFLGEIESCETDDPSDTVSVASRRRFGSECSDGCESVIAG